MEIEAPKSYTNNQASQTLDTYLPGAAALCLPHPHAKNKQRRRIWLTETGNRGPWLKSAVLACSPSSAPFTMLGKSFCPHQTSSAAFYGWCHLQMLHRGEWREGGAFRKAAHSPVSSQGSHCSWPHTAFWEICPWRIDLYSGFSPRDKRTYWICQRSFPDGACGQDYEKPELKEKRRMRKGRKIPIFHAK